uniref:Disease resistance R13L4/SHOC-2-like LRR domain-containing protein n=1 Tax=Musa acuminata subsp. malaccensis TaxID=214687 RepID=A0A804IHU9_MUSAM
MYDPDDWFSSWTGEDCCGWRGVACDHTTGHVTKLDLHYPYTYDKWDISDIMETMGGSKVNPSLQELKHLKYLDLSMNNFSHAPVPKMIASLVHLKYLNLSYAMLDGLIPPQFGNLSNLHYLDLRGWYDDHLHVNDLDWLSHIPSLKYLDMSLVDLSKATNWLCIINSIPTLEVLHLKNADLPYVPSPLPTFNLTTIATLDLSRNSNITSAMLRWLSNATSLEYLLLSGCKSLTIESLQVALGALSNLKELDLSHNFLKGEILGILNNVSSRGLKQLDLSRNYLSGDIPQTLWNLRHLEYLDLSRNANVTGHIPAVPGNLMSLRYLYLRRNLITGEIPPSIGNLTNLVFLDLSFNNIVGSIPETIGALIHMEVLYLDHNQVSGEIPATIGVLQNLHELHLGGNSIIGQIPNTIGRLHSLEYLDISNNNLSGQIPRTMGGLCNLTRNHLNGTMPSSMGRISQLRDLYLSSNSLNDTKSVLRIYDYYYGESILIATKGSMVEYTTILSLVTCIDLSNNHLSGEIPKELTKLLGLRFLNLSNNHLTGMIPENIGDMKQLESLDLSENSLTGEIPSSFSAMYFLAHLNLSYNNLSGKIPTSGQLSTFDSSTYVGNKDLCGTPLADCPVYQTPPDARVKHEDDEKLDKLLEYTSIVIGFVVGFWLFIGTLVMKQAIRFAFFRWIDKASDWVYVQFAVKLAKLKSKWRTMT